MNICELYDYTIFGILVTAILMSLGIDTAIYTKIFIGYTLFFTSYIVRPLVPLLLLWFSPKNITYNNLLYYSSILMGFCSLVIGSLPVDHRLSIFTIILLSLMRVLQGIAVSLEFPLSIEIANKLDKSSHNLFSCISFVSGVLGMLTGSLICYIAKIIFNQQAFLVWGWRIPFLMGSVLIVAAYFVRKHYFIKFIDKVISVNGIGFFKNLISIDRLSFTLVLLLSGISASLFFPTFFLIPKLIILMNKPYHYANELSLMTYGLLMYGITMLICAYILDKLTHRKTVIKITQLLSILVLFPLFSSLQYTVAFIQIVVYLLITMLISVMITPIPKLLVSLTSKSKYNSLTLMLGYNLGVALVGGLSTLLLSISQKHIEPHTLIPLYYAILAGVLVLAMVASLDYKWENTTVTKGHLKW